MYIVKSGCDLQEIPNWHLHKCNILLPKITKKALN